MYSYCDLFELSGNFVDTVLNNYRALKNQAVDSCCIQDTSNEEVFSSLKMPSLSFQKLTGVQRQSSADSRGSRSMQS